MPTSRHEALKELYSVRRLYVLTCACGARCMSTRSWDEATRIMRRHTRTCPQAGAA